MNRREFIKKAVQMGGVAALYNLGVTLKQARAWGVLPATIMEPSVSGGPWSSWDESSESTLDVDQDGDGVEDTYICFKKNTSAGGDETGRGGGLSGSDLVLTQNGNIAGATGGPPYRQFDGSDDYFTLTSNAADVLVPTSDTFTAIAKTSDNDARTYAGIIDLDGANARLKLSSDGTTARKLSAWADDAGGRVLSGITTNTWSNTGDVYIAMWADGTYIRAGFTTIKPTKWSDFASGDRVSVTDSISWSSGIFDSTRYVGRRTGYFADAKFYYVVLSDVCLIDNAS